MRETRSRRDENIFERLMNNPNVTLVLKHLRKDCSVISLSKVVTSVMMCFSETRTANIVVHPHDKLQSVYMKPFI